MWVVILTNVDNEVLRGYGPYAHEDDAKAAVNALKILFPIDPEEDLWVDMFKLETFNGYQYTGTNPR